MPAVTVKVCRVRTPSSGEGKPVAIKNKSGFFSRIYGCGKKSIAPSSAASEETGYFCYLFGEPTISAIQGHIQAEKQFLQTPGEGTFGFGAMKFQDFFPSDSTPAQAMQHVVEKLLHEKGVAGRVRFTEEGLNVLTIVYVPFSIPRSKDVTPNDINKALSTLGRLLATDTNAVEILWQSLVDSVSLNRDVTQTQGLR